MLVCFSLALAPKPWKRYFLHSVHLPENLHILKKLECLEKQILSIELPGTGKASCFGGICVTPFLLTPVWLS